MHKDEWNKTDLRNSKAYGRDFWPAVIAYSVAAIVASIVAAKVDIGSASAWWYGLVLLPTIPALWGVRAVSRHLSRIDEYQHEVHLQGMALGFALAMIASLAIGFLSSWGVETDGFGPWVVFVAGMAGWAVHTTRHGVVR